MSSGFTLSNTQRISIAGAILLVFSVGTMYVLAQRNADPGQGSGQVACTADAKLCPDGSVVGRVGPNCEFAACPISGAGSVNTVTMARLSTHIAYTIEALGVSVTPHKIIEDSRCPIDVQCIQAGTVRLSATVSSGLGNAPATFVLGQPLTTEAEVVTLVEVSPAPLSTHHVEGGEYLLTFEIKKR